MRSFFGERTPRYFLTPNTSIDNIDKTMDAIHVPDEPRSTDMSDRVYPEEYEGHFSNLLITHEEIMERTSQLAKLIHKDYKGTRPVLLCVLKGSGPFYNRLLDALQNERQGFYTEFIRVSSYEGTETSGNIEVLGGLKFKDLAGKDVILVEDIVDTGTTMYHLMPKLKEMAKVKSIEICTLLTKRLPEPAKVSAKYVGFSIPNHFVVGCGLDYNEVYRDVKDIYIISQKGIEYDVNAEFHS